MKQVRPTVGADELRRVRVLGRFDELDLSGPQILELLELEPGPQQSIREQLQHQALIARQELTPAGNRLRAAGRIEGPADTLDSIDEGERVTFAGPFFQQPGDQGGDSQLADCARALATV